MTSLATHEIYEAFKGQLDTPPYESDPTIDGKHYNADWYGPRIDDGILEAIVTVTRHHLNGEQLLPSRTDVDRAFLQRLRCVDSLSDYLILALQAVALALPYEVRKWNAPLVDEALAMETGYLKTSVSEMEIPQTIRLVELSDLCDFDRLGLTIPTKDFTIREAPSRQDQLLDVPAFGFVSHAWVDWGMPDTEDGKFYRVFLLLALNVYLRTGVQHFWIDYLCVSQDPSACEVKARQISEIPYVVSSASLKFDLCLEQYQYSRSAWCVLESLLFLGQAEQCQPLDFSSDYKKTTYFFGMNAVDVRAYSASEMPIAHFTDSRLKCGSPTDVEFLNEQIPAAKTIALRRIWALATNSVLSVIGGQMMDLMFIVQPVIREPILQFLGRGLQDFPCEKELLQRINSALNDVGQRQIPEEHMPYLQHTMWACRAVFLHTTQAGALFGQDFNPVVPREGADIYAFDDSRLTTTYTFSRQQAMIRKLRSEKAE